LWKILPLRLYELPDATIPGPLNVIGKITGGQFAHAAMIGYTFTADPFARTWFVRTITVLHVFFIVLAIHCETPLEYF
jgi:hypothetical protein